MPKEKPGKITLEATHEEFFRDKAFVKFEGDLTEGQWKAIVDGLTKLINLYTGLKQELISQQKQEKFIVSPTLASPQHQSFV